MKAEYIEILDRAIARWGAEVQPWMAVEEAAELTKEICKNLIRGEDNIEALQEEVADVVITISQAVRIVGEKEVNEFIDAKMVRLKKKLDEQEEL